MGKVVENFYGVELSLTTDAVYGEVSKEEALEAIKKAGMAHILTFNIEELQMNLQWYRAVELNYIQTSKSSDEACVPEGESLKEYIKDIIGEAFDAGCLPELLRIVSTYPGKNLYAAFSSAERNLLK